MALGLNRRYNHLCGLEASKDDLDLGTANLNPTRGWAVRHDSGMAAIVETAPKTNSAAVGGLPTGDDTEGYVLDFGPSVWQVYGAAGSTDISVGTRLRVAVDHENAAGSRGAGDYQPGDVTNEDDVANKVVNVAGLVAMSALANGTRGYIDVMIVPTLVATT